MHIFLLVTDFLLKLEKREKKKKDTDAFIRPKSLSSIIAK